MNFLNFWNYKIRINILYQKTTYKNEFKRNLFYEDRQNKNCKIKYKISGKKLIVAWTRYWLLFALSFLMRLCFVKNTKKRRNKSDIFYKNVSCLFVLLDYMAETLYNNLRVIYYLLLNLYNANPKPIYAL